MLSLDLTPPRLWLRLERHGDMGFYARAPETGDGIILNANLAELSGDACAAFLDKIEKPYLIDPMSHRFTSTRWTTAERDGETANKRNYARLWRKYSADVPGWSGDPLRDVTTLSRLSETGMARYAQNVINFQELQLRHAWVEEAARYVGMDGLFGPPLAPIATIAPYLVVTDANTLDDLRVLAGLCEATASLVNPRPSVAIIPVERKVLSKFDSIRQIGTAIGNSGVKAAFIWPIQTTELELGDDPTRFTGLRLLIRTLAGSGVQAAMLYGGFVSLLLREFGSVAISHGLAYGESRGLEPSGGRPVGRWYLPPLHRFISYDDAAQLFRTLTVDRYLAEICQCDVCRALLSGGLAALDAFLDASPPPGAKRAIPTTDAQALNAMHFLLVRASELEQVRNRPTEVVIAQMLEAAERYPSATTRALRVWADRLRAA